MGEKLELDDWELDEEEVLEETRARAQLYFI